MTATLSALCIALYLGAAAVLLRRFGPDATGPAPVPYLDALAALALLLHALLLYRGIVTDTGLNLGFFNAASLIAWVIALMLTLTALSKPVASLGVLVFPLAALGVLLDALFTADRFLSLDAGIGVQTHVLMSIVAYSVLAIGTLQALVLYVQEGRLRTHRPGRVTRLLPALQLQEALLVQMLTVGFFLLSLSLVTGIMFVQDLLGQHLVHKTVLSSAAWLLFAIVLYGRWRYGWRGRRLSRWALGGFCVLMLAYFGSKLVLEVVLERSWTSGA